MNTKKKPDTYSYPAVFTPGDKKGFWLFFPDLEGAMTEGDSLEETMAMGKECLEVFLYSLEERNIPIPKASPIEKIKPNKGQYVKMITGDMKALREEENKIVRKNIGA